MADAAVSALVTDVLGRLTSLAIQEFGLLRGLDDDVSALGNSFRQIQDVLQDAEEKQRKQKAVEEWLRSLKSASLEVENVLDEVSTEAMLQRLHKERGIKYRVRAFFSSDHNRLMVRSRIAHKVKNIRRKLDAIAAKRSYFDLTPAIISVESGVEGETMSRETSSLLPLAEILGRDAEMNMLTAKICNIDIVRRHDVDDVRVCALWGMGGAGKTVLAQLVYNHERVKRHFKLKSWVNVSNEFDVKKVTREIIESIDGQRCELPQLDAMHVYLQDRLRGMRFLIVLDDVWNGDKRKWDAVTKGLSCGVEGSIVLVTTRSQQIGTMMARSPKFLHKVGCLSLEDSWLLFTTLAFGMGRELANIRELEPIGKDIVKKCQGVPLAVKALGSLMRSKTSADEWQRVKESEIWELEEDEVQILPALTLSYVNLSPHLKRCFAYCCLFPKGYNMPKDMLIELWMANGFITSTRDADLYVLGEEIFNCLVRRSFFQDVQEEKEYLGMRTHSICKMHALMHDLAQYVMGHDCTLIEPGMELITPDHVLHVRSSSPDFLNEHFQKLRSLRSIVILVDEYGYKYEGSISQIFNHRYLRLLHLTSFPRKALPESICKLKHLRYLNMSESHIEVLPESIIYLQNLLVLLLRWCVKLRKLPEGMRYMRNLQHLDISSCYNLKCMPVGMNKLVGMRRLSNFIVGEKNGARIGELGDLNLLGGELELSKLENVGGLEDAKSANMKCKKNLISLALHWRDSRLDSLLNERDEKVLEGLEPNLSLKMLEIWYYMGKQICPSWMVNLGNLVRMEFYDFEKCECIPPLGRLPSLMVIKIRRMDSLKCFHDDDNNTSGDNVLFPSLQELYISMCRDLVSLPSNFPKLKELTIFECQALDSLPSNLPELREFTIFECQALDSLPDGLQNLEKLSIGSCEILRRRCEKEIGVDWPKISHIPHIDIW